MRITLLVAILVRWISKYWANISTFCYANSFLRRKKIDLLQEKALKRFVQPYFGIAMELNAA